MKHLAEVLEALEKNQLKLNLKKCEFIAREILFLRFIVSGGQLKMNPMKTRALEEWPIPKIITEIRCFMGLASFYRKLIRSFGAITTSITDCLKKAKFSWT